MKVIPTSIGGFLLISENDADAALLVHWGKKKFEEDLSAWYDANDKDMKLSLRICGPENEKEQP